MAAAWGVMTALVALLLWVIRTPERKWLEWLVKPAAAVCFIATAALAGAFESTYGITLFVGLVLAAVGDVLLIPKDRRAFLGGLVSFLLGHIGYAAAFSVRGLDPTWFGGAVVVLALTSIPVLRWLWPHVETEMRIPVAIYIVVITLMVALAVGTVAAVGDPRILIGAVGFYLSDLAVARERFVRPGYVNRLWGLPLYFYSQLMLAVTA